ncbi:helix-turn-helix domain-containing protein [Bacteroides uniformis]|uniref:helix-turn-helix domain-containing protein n=2 Tax=Bacteroidia TaxID=200643 RepID=UPI00351104AB
MQHREVNYYASKLHISPKYLSTSVKTVSGRTVREWINEAVIKEIKYQLLNTALSIKEISGKLGFSDLSSLGKYFKTQTGVSPKTYRMSGEDVNLIVKNEIHFTT